MYDRPRVGGRDLKIIQFKQNIFSRRRSKLVDQTDNLFPVSKNVLFNKILFFTALQTFPFYIAEYLLYQILTSNCIMAPRVIRCGCIPSSSPLFRQPSHPPLPSRPLHLPHPPLDPSASLHPPRHPEHTHRENPRCFEILILEKQIRYSNESHISLGSLYPKRGIPNIYRQNKIFSNALRMNHVTTCLPCPVLEP